MTINLKNIAEYRQSPFWGLTMYRNVIHLRIGFIKIVCNRTKGK